jgi:hypothetical protein
MSQPEISNGVASAVATLAKRLRAWAIAASPCKKPPIDIRVRWISFAQVRRERLAQAIASDPGRKIFSDDFFKAIYERKREQERIYWAIVLFNVPVSAALLLNALSASPHISILGIELSEISKIKEALFFFLSTVNIFAAIMFFDVADLTMTLDAGVAQTTPGPLRTFAGRKYSEMFGKFPDPMGPDPRQFAARPILQIVFAVFVALLMLFLAVWLGVALVIQFVMFYDIWTKPSLPPLWAHLVVVYGMLVLLYWCAAAFLAKAPLPYWDYSVAQKMWALRARNPAAHARRWQGIVRLSQQPRRPLRRFIRAFKRRYLIKRQYKI